MTILASIAALAVCAACIFVMSWVAQRVHVYCWARGWFAVWITFIFMWVAGMFAAGGFLVAATFWAIAA